MAIHNLDELIAAQSQRVGIIKTASMTTVATIPFTVFAQAGNPGAGPLAGINTIHGVVPVASDAGFPSINAFSAGDMGYINRVEFGATVACRLTLFDLLWKGGAYPHNANVAVSPSWFGHRTAWDSGFEGIELWFEQVTPATGIQSVNVTYTNSYGIHARTTGPVSQGAAGIVGRMTPMPLATGDKGVMEVTHVTGTVATAGTFNVLVMRRLWQGRVHVANSGDVHDMLRTGMPQVFQDSALYLVVQTDATASGVIEVVCEIVSG